MQQQSRLRAAARGTIRSRLVWVVAAGLAVIAVTWGVEGVS